MSSRSFKELVRDKLSDCIPRTVEDGYTAEAGVLMAIFEQQNEPVFLLTLRTEHVATHKGQVSFPGGLREAGDASLWETALREAQEEVGILPEEVEILGEFHQYLAVTNWLVIPFVGFLREGFSVSPNPREVQSLLEVPLEFFRRTQPKIEMRERLGKKVPVYFYDYLGHTIWGLTAKMIKDFMELLEV